MTERTGTPEAAAELARLHANLDAANRACEMADTDEAKDRALANYLVHHRAYHDAKGK